MDQIYQDWIPAKERTMIKSACITLCCVFMTILVSVQAQDTYVWVEAESGDQMLEHENPWWTPVDKQTSLSGSEWWHTFDEPQMKDGFLKVHFEIKKQGVYVLWLRLDRAGTGYRYSLNGEELKELPLAQWMQDDKDNRRDINYKRRVFDESFASHDGSNRHRLVWVRGPEMNLKSGDHTLEVRALRGNDNKGWGGLDCFVLAGEDFDFMPRMFYKPGEKVQTVVEIDSLNVWPFPAKQDTFQDTPIDLRFLNEKVAGENGFIRRSEDGESFVRGDGTPIRFWSGSDYAWRGPFDDDNLLVSPQEEAEADHHARWLAKRGINMVRFHGNLFPKKQRRSIEEVTRETINESAYHGAWYMVYMMKKHGIYSTISPYWGSHTDNEPGWDLGFKGGNLTGLVFFYKPVKEMYKTYVKRLYTEVNPYTGIPLKDDPAVALIQLQNEDSLLFFTAARITGEPLQELNRQFGDFLKEKYGSLEKAFERYETYESGWDLRGEDNIEKGTAGVLQSWFFTQDAGIRADRWSEKTRNRLDDQLEFYTMLMYDFNKEMETMFRDEIGCKQLINAGNWKSVDPITADDAERYAYTANDVIAKNGYYGSIHAGINTGWQILTQQVYTNWSALKRPRFWPTNIKMVDNYPFLITESLWVPPNLYSAEGPLLVAGQMSLTGLDSFYWFSSGTGEWSPHDKKWGYTTPMMLGQFPATALAFRKGYIQQADEPVVYEERSLEDIWQQKTPLISETEVWDPNRDMGEMPVESKVQTPVDPLAFCVGPVEVKYGGNAENNKVSPELDTLIDKDKKTLKSVTGEITTDYANGVYMVNAPKFQGAAGFLKTQDVIQLGNTTIECDNDYASIVAVCLDDKPLAESEKILVQVGTVARPDGWIVRDRVVVNNEKEYEGVQILEKGGDTLLIENTKATWSIRNPKLANAVALDENGVAIEAKITLERKGDTLHVKLPANALYTIISSE